MKENKEKAVTSGDEDVQVQDNTIPFVVQKVSCPNREEEDYF